jgi:hypothetical protein
MTLAEALDLLIAITIFVAVLAAALMYGQSWRAVGRAFEYAASHPPDRLNGAPEQDHLGRRCHRRPRRLERRAPVCGSARRP